MPTKPLNLSSHGITSTTIELSWAEPDYANGIISGYRIYYMHSNYTDVQMYRTDEYDGPVIEFVLKELGELVISKTEQSKNIFIFSSSSFLFIRVEGEARNKQRVLIYNYLFRESLFV